MPERGECTLEKSNKGGTDLEKAEKEAQLEKLWLLLLKDPTKISKEEIDSLLKEKEKIHDLLGYKYQAFPDNLGRVLQYHKRKEELSKLSTEELKKIDTDIRLDRTAAFESLSDEEEEEIGDSNFAEPPIDSTEHIVFELLKEREASEIGRSHGKIDSEQ